ncbi:MAG: DUF3667 domain-containing protein [Bacteroidaceae bacterium]|nr:DUF3667 domain-containing protein [Bacteroidaceae bacterium]
MEVKEDEKLSAITETTTQCLNCGNTFQGNFCPHCGQNAKTKRLKIGESIMDFTNSIIGGDNKFVRTLHDICFRPGYMIREYLKGHRCIYYNPVQMLIYLLTIYSILTFLIGGDPFMTESFDDLDLNIDKESKGVDFFYLCVNLLEQLFDNKLYITIISALLAVLPFRYVYRNFNIERPDGAMLPLSMTEQFYTLTYESCLQTIFATLLLPISFIKGSEVVTNYINHISDVVFSIIIFMQLYNISWKTSMKRTVLAVIMNLVFIVAIFIEIIVPIIIGMGIYRGIEEMMK